MALVNIDTVLRDTLRLLKKTDPPGGVLLMSYKRNRSIAVIKTDESGFEVREDGYQQQVLEVSMESLSRELKVMIKREFPRSRKVRLIKISDPQELECERKKL
jgi:hypothetical protein